MKNSGLILFAFIFALFSIAQEKQPQKRPYARSTYIPLDPMPVRVIKEKNYTYSNKDILESLPDETTKFASISLDDEGKADYMGIVNVSGSNKNYEVIFDWIKYSAVHALIVKDGHATLILSPSDFKESEFTIKGNGKISILSDSLNEYSLSENIPEGGDIIKIIMGVGSKDDCQSNHQKRKLKVANIISLGAEASRNHLEGSIEINTMGITGESITSLVPLPTNLSESSIQSLLVNVAAIREKIYTIEKNDSNFLKVMVTPRVVGYQNLSNKTYSPNEVSTLLYKAMPFLWIKDPSKSSGDSIEIYEKEPPIQ